MAGLLTL